MARALIVGCGCHGRDLGAALLQRGWQVRGTSRAAERIVAIERAGLEGAVADPDRPGTVLDLVGDVTVVVWLLGSCRGAAPLVGAIHGPRLERLLERLVDTPVRGFAYEAVGDVPDRLLSAGRETLARAAETWRIPVTTLESPRSEAGWTATSADRVSGLIGAKAAG